MEVIIFMTCHQHSPLFNGVLHKYLLSAQTQFCHEELPENPYRYSDVARYASCIPGHIKTWKDAANLLSMRPRDAPHFSHVKRETLLSGDQASTVSTICASTQHTKSCMHSHATLATTTTTSQSPRISFQQLRTGTFSVPDAVFANVDDVYTSRGRVVMM